MPGIRYKLVSVTARVTDQDNDTVLAHLPSKPPLDRSLPYLKSIPSFDGRLNAGLGECVLDVGGYLFDDFNEGGVVAHMNLVDLIANVVDQETMAQTSYQVYRGFVSSYEPYLEGGNEGVRMTVLGLASLLTASKYGTSPAYTVTHTGVDPGAIFQAILDHFAGVFGGSLISYAGQVSSVGTNVTKEFTDLSWFDAIGEDLKLADEGWWWFVDADGQAYFQDRPSTVSHTFTLKRDIEGGRFLKTAEKVRNEIIIERSGGTRVAYSDATSQATYGTGSPATGKWTEIVSDSTITDATTSGQAGNRKLGGEKDAKISGSLTINRMYPIDTIRPGQCCAIANFKGSNAFFGSNVLQIVSMTWQGDTVTLELEQQTRSLARELTEFVNAS